jgi:hypothetical protein
MHVVRAYIVYKQRFSVVEEQHAAQPVIRAAIAYKLGTAPPIPYCDPKMMIAAADVVCDTRLRTCKDKDARFPVATDFIIDKGRPTFRPVNHYARQNALRHDVIMQEESSTLMAECWSLPTYRNVRPEMRPLGTRCR